tara:strand:- start:180 stop:518 length:339 start_codon:yes stop_codon:yes gene_type:complete
MDIFSELPIEIQKNIFEMYIKKKKKEKINNDIIKLLKDRSPFNLNSIYQLKDSGGTKKMCLCGEQLQVDTTNSIDSPCYTSPICILSYNSNGNIYYNKRHNKKLHKKLSLSL